MKRRRRKVHAILRAILFLSVILSGLKTASGQNKQKSPPGENRQQQGQEAIRENFKFTADVSLVTTDVTVIGATGHELKANDFTIFDNEIAQQVSFFSRDEIPLAIALAIDSSSSIQQFLPVLQMAAISALRRLKPEDQVALYTFNATVTKLNDLTEDRLQIAEKVGKIDIQYGTNIYDTLYHAAKHLHKNAPNRRRAIILISDNCHLGNSLNTDQMAQVELLETAATLYNLRTPGDSGYMNDLCAKSDAAVKRMTAETGGEVIEVRAAASLQKALETAITNLRLQYTLGFNPSVPGENGSFHKLAVKLSAEDRCPKCQLLTRNGYYAGVSQPALPLKSNAKTPPKNTPQKEDQILMQRSILAAGTNAKEFYDIPFMVAAANQKDAKGQPQVKINLLIDCSKIGFKIVEDCHACKLRAVVFFFNEKMKIISSEWREISGELKEETYNQVINAGLEFHITVPVKTPKQTLKIVVFDEFSDKVGSKFVRMN